ncbi:hypothetical protein FOCC_FOCC000553, partial [Frankliniella occidentalis]
MHRRVLQTMQSAVLLLLAVLLPVALAAPPYPLGSPVYDSWAKCLKDRQCGEPHQGNVCEVGCSEGDEKCKAVCGWNCIRHCAGLPTTATDWEDVKETRDLVILCVFEKQNGCSSQEMKCRDGCRWWDFSCSKLACRVESKKCLTKSGYDCHYAVANRRSSTSEAVVTSSTQAVKSSTDKEWTWQNYAVCVDQSCDLVRSSAPEFQAIREANCSCSCMGLPGGDLEAYASEAVQRCLGDCGDQETQCDQRKE